MAEGIGNALGKILYGVGRVLELRKFEHAAVNLYNLSSNLGGNAMALYRAGTHFFNQNDWPIAAEYLHRAVMADPTRPHWHYKLGFCLDKLGDRESAMNSIRKAIALSPERQEWRSHLQEVGKRMLNDTAVTKTELTEQAGEIPLAGIVDQAMAAITNKEWTTAETLLKEAIIDQPEAPELYWMLGQTLEKLGRSWEVTEIYGKAVELDPTRAEWHYNHGVLLERMNRFDEAVAAYERALALEPEKSDWHYRRGYVLEQLGREEEATLAYAYAVEYDGTGLGKRFGPGAYHAKRGLWDDAATAYAHQAEDSTNAELFYRLGMAHDRCYRWSDAADGYERAVALDSTQSYWHYRLGYVRERMAQWDTAAAAYQAAIERKPTYDSYWFYRLATVMQEAGRLEEACEAYLRTRKRQDHDKPAMQAKSLHFLKHKPEYYDYVNELPRLEDVVLYEGADDPECKSPLFHEFESRVASSDGVADTHVWILPNQGQPPEAYITHPAVVFVTHGSDLHLRYLATAGEVLLSDSVRDEFDEAARSRQEKAERWYNVGQIHEQCCRWDLAAKAYQTAVALNAVDETWHWRLGLMLEQLDRYEEASTAYRAAIARSEGNNAYWHYRLGATLYKAGRFEEACTAFRWTRVLGRPYGLDTSIYTKDIGFRTVAEYTEYRNTLGIEQNTILYESYHGASMACNPYALFQYFLSQPEYAGWTHIWVINDRDRIPEAYRALQNVCFVSRGSERYVRYLASVKFLVNNVTFPEYFIRRPEQLYLNTWHGTPLKTLGKDIQSHFFEHRNAARNFLQASHIISPNAHTTNTLLDRYDLRGIYSGKIAETGYPRIDMTLNSEQERRQSLKARLGIETNAKVVLYAPTWRGTSSAARFDDEKLLRDIESLSQMNCALLFRGHHMVEKLLSSSLNHADVVVVPGDVDTNELLSIVDVLVTDYSSIFYDFLVTGRPIIHYVYDYEEYASERGLYFPLDEWPGQVCRDVVQLKVLLAGLFKVRDWQPGATYKAAQERFCGYDDGHATKRVAEFLLSSAVPAGLVNSEEKRKRILFFEGYFIPNGISTSFVSLINSLDKSRYLPVVAVSPRDMEGYDERIDEFGKVYDQIPTIGRCGRMLLDPEEKWILDKFYSQHDLPSDEQWTIMQRAFQREFERMFGAAEFDLVVDFEGYSRLWALIFGLGAPRNVNKVIYQHNDMERERLVRFPYLKGIFNLSRYYDRFISVAKDSYEQNRDNIGRKLELPLENFQYCSNAIEPNMVLEFAGHSSDAEQHPWLTNPEITTFINVARLSPEKGQGKLIQAFSQVNERFPDTRLLILGDGPLRHELELQARQLGVYESVQLLGLQVNPFPFVRQSDCFVFSSDHEGQGLALVEALILGKPTISTDIPGPRSVLEGGFGLLVENSTDGLVEGMSRFMEGSLTFEPFDADQYVRTAMRMFYTNVCGESDPRHYPMKVAHRGGAGLLPENTLIAFEAAIEMGMDAAELDVHLTKDGYVVVHHNAALDRRLARRSDGRWLDTGERVEIGALSYEELCEFEVGIPDPHSDYLERFPRLQAITGQRLPLLRDVITLAKSRSETFSLIIEFKSDETAADDFGFQELVDATLALVKENGFENRTIFCAFDWRSLRYAKSRCPEIPAWFTTHPLSWLTPGEIPPQDLRPGKKYIDKLRAHMASGTAPWYAGFDPRHYNNSYPAAISAAGGDGWFMYHTDLTDTSTKESHRHKVLAAAWTSGLSDFKVLDAIAARGADAICTDYPDYFQSQTGSGSITNEAGQPEALPRVAQGA